MLLKMCGEMACVLTWAISRFTPSVNRVRAKKSAASAPVAPGLFSTTTERSHSCESCCPTMRANTSVPPPGAQPT